MVARFAQRDGQAGRSAPPGSISHVPWPSLRRASRNGSWSKVAWLPAGMSALGLLQR